MGKIKQENKKKKKRTSRERRKKGVSLLSRSIEIEPSVFVRAGKKFDPRIASYA